MEGFKMLQRKLLSFLCGLTILFSNNTPVNACETLTLPAITACIIFPLTYCAHKANKAKPLLNIPSNCELTLENIRSNPKGVLKYSIIGNRQRSHNLIGSKPFPKDQPNPNNLKEVFVFNDIPGRGIGWVEDRLKELNDATGISKDLALFLLIARVFHKKGHLKGCTLLLSSIFKITWPS